MRQASGAWTDPAGKPLYTFPGDQLGKLGTGETMGKFKIAR